MAESKVILTQTVANLGHSGDVVAVRSGYARNYLIPQGLAFAWTKGAEAQIVQMKRARLAKAVATREDAVAAKAAIEGTTVEIAAKVSESGKLFGSVTAEQIALAMDDLKGKTIAVKNATAGANYAKELKDKYGFKIDTYEDSPTMYQAVVLGQADACVEDKPIMADNIKTGGLDLTIVESTASEVAPYGFAIMNEDNQELLDMFNKGLQEIKDNGTYEEILNKYLGE